MPFHSRSHCSKFHIPPFVKNQCVFTILIVPITLAAAILIGYILSLIYTSAFHKNVVNTVKLAENEILVFLDSTSEMLDMLAQHPYVRAADDSLHTYTTETQKVSPFDISRSHTEENILLLFESIYAGFSDYLEILLGTKWGGFVTSFKGELPGGYDPRKRIWYQHGANAQGKIVLTKAFYTHNLASSVVVLVKSIYDRDHMFTGNIAISLSLNTLTAKLAKFSIGTGGALILMQEDGTILADPMDPRRLFTHIIATDIPQPQRFMQATDRLQPIIIDNKNMLFQVYSIPKLNWKLIAFVDEQELWNECSWVLHYIGITGTLLTIIIGFFLILRMLRMINPVQQILILLQFVSNTAYPRTSMHFDKADIELLPEHCNTLLNELREEIVLVTATPDIGL